MILGSVWADKKKAHVFTIVKIIRPHGQDLVVLVLDLLTGETQELMFNTTKDGFDYINVWRL